EEEAFLPLRLVGEQVEEAVEAAERVAEAPDGLRERRRALLRGDQDGADFAGERADLILDRGLGLFEEPLAGGERRAEGLGLRDQAEQRRAGGGRERIGARERRFEDRQRLRELDQRLLDRILLVGEIAERDLRGGDEAFDLTVVAAEFGGQL